MRTLLPLTLCLLALAGCQPETAENRVHKAPPSPPVAPPPGAAENPPPTPTNKPQPANAVEQALQRRLDVNIDGWTLFQVAKWFSDQLGVPVEIDRESLRHELERLNEPLTLKVNGIPAESALALLFYLNIPSVRLAQTATGLSLVSEYEPEPLEQRVYDVSEFSADIPAPVSEFIGWGNRPRKQSAAMSALFENAALCTNFFDRRNFVFDERTVVLRQPATVYRNLDRLLDELRSVQSWPAAKIPAPTRSRLAAVEAVMDQRVRCDFAGTSLREVFQRLAAQLPVPLVVQEVYIEQEGLSLDTPITLQTDELTLREVIESLNLQKGQLKYATPLGCSALHDVILVAHGVGIEESHDVRVYDVTDLADDDLGNLARLISSNTGGDEWKGCWWELDGEGGCLTPVWLGHRAVMVIRQGQAIHREIAQLLSRLRGLRRGEPWPASRVAELLQKPCDFTFEKLPLKECLDHIAAESGLRIVVADSDLTHASISLDAPVTLRAGRLTVADGLDLLFRVNGLRLARAELEQGLLVFPAPEDHEAPRTTVVHDVRDLLVTQTPAGEWIEDAGGLMRLIETPSAHGQGADWQEVGLGAGTMQLLRSHGQGALVVRQTCAGQEHIARMLAALRRVQSGAARSIVVEHSVGGVGHVRQALARPRDWSWQAVPARDIARRLQETLGVPVIFAEHDFADEKFEFDRTFTLQADGIPADLVLERIGNELGIWGIVKHGVLLLAPLRERIHWHDGQLFDRADWELVLFDITGLSPVYGPLPETKVYHYQGQERHFRDYPREWGPFRKLVESLYEIQLPHSPWSEPDSWFGHDGHAWPLSLPPRGVLAVLQTPEMLREIDRRLTEQRKAIAVGQSAPIVDAFQRKLAGRFPMWIDHLPVRQALNQVATQLRIPFRAEVPDEAATVTLKVLRLNGRQTLDQLARISELAWELRDGTLLFTPAERPVTRRHDVSDLVLRTETQYFGWQDELIDPQPLTDLAAWLAQRAAADLEDVSPPEIRPHRDGPRTYLDVRAIPAAQQEFAELLDKIRACHPSRDLQPAAPDPDREVRHKLQQEVRVPEAKATGDDLAGLGRKLEVEIIAPEWFDFYTEFETSRLSAAEFLDACHAQWRIHDGAIEFNTDLPVRVYDVNDLVMQWKTLDPDQAPDRNDAFFNVSGAFAAQFSQFSGKLPIIPETDFAPLIRFLKQATASDSHSNPDPAWDKHKLIPFHASGYRLLIVEQTESVHQRIDQTLAGIRALHLGPPLRKLRRSSGFHDGMGGDDDSPFGPVKLNPP